MGRRGQWEARPVRLRSRVEAPEDRLGEVSVCAYGRRNGHAGEALLAGVRWLSLGLGTGRGPGRGIVAGTDSRTSGKAQVEVTL
jgi:hypothetical protein